MSRRYLTPKMAVVWVCTCLMLGLFGCVKDYAVKKIKAHGLTQMPSFTLPDSEGKATAVGKPWTKKTVVVMIRGFW